MINYPKNTIDIVIPPLPTPMPIRAVQVKDIGPAVWVAALTSTNYGNRQR